MVGHANTEQQHSTTQTDAIRKRDRERKRIARQYMSLEEKETVRNHRRIVRQHRSEEQKQIIRQRRRLQYQQKKLRRIAVHENPTTTQSVTTTMNDATTTPTSSQTETAGTNSSFVIYRFYL